MKKYIKRMIAIALTVMLTITFIEPIQAAPRKYTGTYIKIGNVQNVEYKPAYVVIINKITNKKVKLQLGYIGTNCSPLYVTAPITAKRKGKTAKFKWRDSWGNSGNGILKLYKGYVKVKVKVNQTKTEGWNRGNLSTNGKYLKIYKKSNNTRLEEF